MLKNKYEDIVSQTREQLGSVIEIKLQKQHFNFFNLCFEEIERIEKTYSRFIDSSLLMKMNKNLNKWQNAPEEYIKIIEYALEFNKKTQGYFDITLKSSLENIGYDKEYSFKPKEVKNNFYEKIKGKFLEPVLIDKEKKRVLLRKEIEFGGLGKGYALDCVSKILESKGVDCYYINGGGDIYAKQGSGEPWTILLEHPDDFEKVIGKLDLDGKSLACSAPNRRRWGKYHHLINSKTKKPENSVKSIFVLADTAVEADAYATALFTSGFENARKIYQELPVEVLIISNENKVFKSEGFRVEFFN